MSEARVVTVEYYSDLLCVWAYIAEIRLNELRSKRRDEVSIVPRFVSLFGSTDVRIGQGWAERGGFEAYAKHVQEAAAGFDHVEVHPELWLRNVPAGSYGPHAFVKAAALAAPERGSDELTWRMRCAFFHELRDIGRLGVQLEIAQELGLPGSEIRGRLEDGSALAALATDHEAARNAQITGSPTFLLNEGRQKLYGNIGYRILDANIQELLTDNRDRASWC